MLYRTLKSHLAEIRILHILPHDDRSGLLECRLEHVSLETVHFEALSYTWGETSTPASIMVNNAIVRVTVNSHAALLALRYKDAVRKVWIDALCINQHDVDERNREVVRMLSIH